MKWKQFIDEFGGGLKKYQKAGEIKNEDASYINFVRSLPSNLQQPNDPSYNLKGYWNALGKPESFDYNQPTDLQGYYHAFSRDPYTGQILKAPFHPSFKEGVSDKGAYRIAGPKGDIYTQGFKYPAYEGPYALPKNVIIDNSYDFLDIPNYEGYFQIGGSLPKYQDNGEVKPTDQTQPIVYSRPYPFDPYAAKNKVVSQKDVDDYNVYIQGNQPSRNFFYETHDLTKDQSGNYMWNPKKDIDYQKAIQNTSLGQFIDIVGGISKTSTDQFGNQYNTRSTGLEMGYNPYNIWASPSTGIGFYDSEYPGNVLMQLDHLENKDTYPTIYFLNNKNYELGNPKDWNSAQNDLYGKENLSTEQKERLAADNLMKVENSPTAYEIVSTDAPIDEKYVNAFGYKNDLIRLINPNLNVSGALPVTKELLAELRGIEEGFTGTNYEDQLNKEIEIKKMLLTRAGIPITDENLKTLMHYNYTPLNIYSEINRPGYPSVYKDLKKKGGSLPEFQPGGTNKPIYTSDWSKVKNYNDSLNLYNKTRDIENPNYYEQGFPSWYTHRGTREEIERFMRRNNMDVDYTGRFPGNIQPVATGYFGEGIKYPIYKKPFQPYIYDPYKEFLGRLGDVKPMGIRPTDLGAESEMPRTVNIPTRTLNSNLPRVKHSANYFESPEIVTHRTPEEGFYIEIRTPLKKTTSKPSNSKVVYQNYKQVGGEQSTEENPKVLPLTNVSSKKADWIVDKEKHGIDEIKWYESWNPKKWGLNDYSEYSSFNSAFRNARENKEEEFVYKGKRYNTQLIPKEDSDLYWESKNFLKDYYKNQPYKKIDDAYDYDFNRNVDPYLKSKYGNTWQELYEMQKQVPTGNPEWEEIQKKMNDVWDEQETIREKKNKDYDAYYKKNVIGKQSGERIASLDKPTYFSITNQKPKDMSEDGYWNPKENKMFMLANTEPGKLNTTYIHELSHKGDDIIDVMNTVPPINLEAFNAAPYKEDFTQESFNYVSDPSETEARKLSTLFYLKKNKQPWKAGKITEETLNKLYEDHYDKKLPYDVSQLLMLYGAQRDDLLKYLNGDFEYNYKPKEKQTGGEELTEEVYPMDVSKAVKNLTFTPWTDPIGPKTYTAENFKSLWGSFPKYNQGYESIYDVDQNNMGIQQGPLATQRFQELKNLGSEEQLKSKYFGKPFGGLPFVEGAWDYIGYAPNRIWVNKNQPYVSAKEEGKQANEYVYFLTPRTNSDYFGKYVNEKTLSDNSKFEEEVKKGLVDKQNWKGQSSDWRIPVWGASWWGDSDVKDVKSHIQKLKSNPEIVKYAQEKGIDLDKLGMPGYGTEESKKDLKDANTALYNAFFESLMYQPEIDENRNLGLVHPWTRRESFVIQNPSEFNLSGYLPISDDMYEYSKTGLFSYDYYPEESSDFNFEENEKPLRQLKLWDKGTREKYLKQAGVPEDLWDSVYIHTSRFPIQEYQPGKEKVIPGKGLKTVDYMKEAETTAANMPKTVNIPARVNPKDIKSSRRKNKKGYEEGGESNIFNWSNLDQWFKNGGESDFANNIYDDYMTGIYDGTPLEGYAKKVYDKLNTMYYTQAKQAGMTPPNYIMTNVIKKSTAPS